MFDVLTQGMEHGGANNQAVVSPATVATARGRGPRALEARRQMKSTTIRPGDRFGRWLVLSLASKGSGTSVRWLCQCDCGTTRPVRQTGLRAGSQSCGCLKIELRKQGWKHGQTGTAEYNAWRDIRKRCLSPGCPEYPNYGGRGITMCERWQESFANFLADMGPKPSPEHSIDRRDNNGPYTPENCRWATKKAQSRNTRSNRLVEFRGERLSMAEWAERTGINRGTLDARLRKGWSLEAAFTTPPIPRAERPAYRRRAA